MTTLGAAIKAARDKRRLSQDQLGELIGVTGRQIRKYETDEQSPAMTPTGVRLAKALGGSLDKLVGLAPPDLDLSGTWYAMWQTKREGLSVLDRHRLVATQTGAAVLLDAAEGDYPWRGNMTLGPKTLRGDYEAVKTDQHGSVFFCLKPDGEAMRGKWMGTFEDGPFGEGFGVLARSEELALSLMEELIATPGLSLAFPEPEPDEES